MTVDKKDKAIQVLAESTLFGSVDPSIVRSMVEAMDVERWSRHAVILSPRQATDRIYIVIKGRVKVALHNQSGRELTLFLFGPGDAFNVENLLDGQDHNYFVETLDPLVALSGPTQLWADALEAVPDFRRAFRKYLEQRLIELANLAGDLALNDTMTRLVHLILRYLPDPRDGERPSLIDGLSHEELASMIGTVRVVINRLLAELRKDAIIDTKSGKMRVLNLENLRAKADRHADDLSAASH